MYFTPILVFNLFEEFNNKLLLLISLPICFFDFKIYAIIRIFVLFIYSKYKFRKDIFKIYETRDEYAEQNIILGMRN